MKKKILKSFISAGLCALLAFSSVTQFVYAEGGYDSELDRIAAEYVQSYPQYKEGIEAKINAFRCRDSYKEYYEENASGAIENIYGVLDCYIDYRENCDNSELPAETASPLATGGDQWGNRYYVDVPLVMQETGYYCGPACAYMAIEGIKRHAPSIVNTGISNTQASHAAAMGTDLKRGTDAYTLMKRLTSMLNGEKYLNDSSLAFTEDELVTYIKNSLNKNGTVVALIRPQDLQIYQNVKYPTTEKYLDGHFVVVSSVYIERSTGKATFTIKDPNNWNNGEMNKTYVLTSSELLTSLSTLLWMNWK
ncbi:MAG: C39 family peptidase [[Eubacterium] siraeum]|nr:C39 family peptidase [[Eubacterium] siraeum]